MGSATTLETSGAVSISQAAEICRCSRDVIRKRIAERGIKAIGIERGNKLFPIFEIVAAYLGVDPSGKRVGKDDKPLPPDPDRMSPSERKSFYDSESKRLDLEERAGKLVPAEVWRGESKALMQTMAQFLESLPDELERGIDLPPEGVDLLHRLTRAQRQRLYDQIVERKRA